MPREPPDLDAACWLGGLSSFYTIPCSCGVPLQQEQEASVVGAMYSVPHHQETGRSDSSIARNRRLGGKVQIGECRSRRCVHLPIHIQHCQYANSADVRKDE